LTSESGLRALLLLAAAGAVLLLLSFLGTTVGLIGVVAIVVATVLTAPAPDAPGPQVAGVRWWRVLATGAVISVVGLPLSLLTGTVGGLLAAIGGALVVVAVAFGFPAPSD
jgi:hypothetical protein